MKSDFYIDRVDKDSCKNLLYNYHYLKDESKDFKSGYNYGLFRHTDWDCPLNIGGCLAVCIFTGLPVPEIAKGAFGLERDEQDGLFELSRLCVDPELQKELMKRKAALDKDKPVDEADHIMQLAKLVSGTSETQQTQASDFANEMKALAGIKEVATAGATSAGNIASVANPAQAYGHRPKDSKGLPKAPQKKKADGTAVNALDMGNNLMGGSTVKR